MMRHFRQKRQEGPPRPLPLLYKILIAIGSVTVIYFFITYVIIPVLAYFTEK